MKTKLLYILVIFYLLASSCIKDKICPNDFVVYGSVTPYSDSYKIGDTISLKSHFSKFVYERKTSQFYDLTDLNIESVLYLFKIDTIISPNYGNVLSYVELISSGRYQEYVQNFSDGGQEYFSNIIFSNDTFYHDIKFIPKVKGMYILTYGPACIENEMDFVGKCRGSFDLTTRLNKDMDNNINLLKDSPDPHFNNWILQNPEERFYNGRFAYRVTD
jgi:hypothetical protein